MLKHGLKLLLALSVSTASVHADALIAGGYAYGTKNGVIAMSQDDGATWKEVWFKENGRVLTIQYLPDVKQYVALGHAGISLSKNGEQWTTHAVTSDFRPLHQIAYGDGMYVAVGERSTIVYSTDGLNWHNMLYKPSGAIRSQALKAWQKDVKGMTRDAHYLSVTFHKGEFLATGSYQRITRFKRSGDKLALVSDKQMIPTRFELSDKIISHKGKLFLFGRYISRVSNDDGKTFSIIRHLRKQARPSTVKVIGDNLYIGAYSRLITFGNLDDADPSNDWSVNRLKSRPGDFWTLAGDGKNTLIGSTASSQRIYISENGGQQFLKQRYRMLPTPDPYSFVIKDMVMRVN